METWQRAEIPTFQRVSVRNIRELEKKQLNAIGQALAQAFTLENLPYYFLGFLLGRACMLGDSFPFGIAYLTYLLGSGPKSRLYTTGAAVFLGILSYYPGLWALDYAVTLLMLMFWDKHLRSFRRIPTEKLPFVALVALLLGRGSVELFRWRGFPGLVSLVLESFAAMLLTAIFIYGFPSLRKGKAGGWRRRALDHEEKVCLTILAIALLMGTEHLQIFGLSLGNIMGRLLILMLSVAGGGGAGAVGGILVGAVGALSRAFSPYTVALSAFSGLLAGAFRRYGKGGVICGFVLGTIIMSLQIAQTSQLTAAMVESLCAIVVFVCMPQAVILTFSRALPGTEERMELEEKKQERLQNLVTKRLTHFAQIFNELSSSFGQGTAVSQEEGKITIERLVEVIGDQICKSCVKYNHCWQENFYLSYQKMLELVAKLEEQGQPTLDGFDCLKLEKIITTLRYLFSMQRLDQAWQQKLVETSNIVSGQLRGIAKVMDNLAAELHTEVSFKEDLEELVQRELSKLGFGIEKVEVMDLEDGKVAVELEKSICDGNEECRKAIGPLVGQILGRNFSIWNVRCGRKNCQTYCTINLVPQRPFSVESSVQRFNKADGIISGDSHALLELQDGKLAVALSDGMGSGPEAAMQSGATISILKRLMESGFDRESAVRTVNSVLLVRSVEETFATIDLAVFDLYTAQVEFIKVGAAPTYIKRGREVVRVDSACLPIGILSSIEIESTTRNLQDGDIVVMVTDGLTQLRRSGGPAPRGDWLARMLMRLNDDDPEYIAYELLTRARELNFNQVEDDMTVLVLKVVSRQEKGIWPEGTEKENQEQVIAG
jgi:stage II sporulation protein E